MDDDAPRVPLGRRRRYRPGQEGLISTDVSAGRQTIAETADTRSPTRWERRAAQQEQDSARAMNLLEQISAHLGGLLALNKAPAPGDILGQVSRVVATGGVSSFTFRQVFQSIHVVNPSGSPLTVASQPPGAQAPVLGTGVAVVPAGAWRTVAMRGNVVSVYGIAGAPFDLTAYARPRPAAAGSAHDVGTYSFVRETTAALGANITFVGTARDGLGTGPARIRAMAASDQAGSLVVQQSPDQNAWFSTAVKAVAAGFNNGTELEDLVVCRYLRIVYINGATAQGSFELDSVLVGD